MIFQQCDEYEYLLLFDLDGTLLDTARQIEICMNQVRLDFGHGVLMPKDYLRLIGQPIDQFLLDLNLCFDEKEQMIDKFRLNLRGEIAKNGVKCFDGVIDIFYLLESLKISVAVATTKPTELAKHTINHSNLRYFKIHIQGTDNFLPKPSPIVINRILDELKPMHALMVGDRIEDMKAASSAGLNSIGIAAGAHKEEDLRSAGANLLFPDFLGLSRFASRDSNGFKGYFSKLNLTFE
jgi:phosphoglycolate phosphatase